jgi:hypothetical protein
MIGPLPATQRGAVLARVNANPCGRPTASVDPGLRAAPLEPPPEPSSKNGPGTKIRQSEVSTLSGDGRVDPLAPARDRLHAGPRLPRRHPREPGKQHPPREDPAR